MTDMIERVARAICFESGEDPDRRIAQFLKGQPSESPMWEMPGKPIPGTLRG